MLSLDESRGFRGRNRRFLAELRLPSPDWHAVITFDKPLRPRFVPFRGLNDLLRARFAPLRTLNDLLRPRFAPLRTLNDPLRPRFAPLRVLNDPLRPRFVPLRTLNDPLRPRFMPLRGLNVPFDLALHRNQPTIVSIKHSIRTLPLTGEVPEGGWGQSGVKTQQPSSNHKSTLVYVHRLYRHQSSR